MMCFSFLCSPWTSLTTCTVPFGSDKIAFNATSTQVPGLVKTYQRFTDAADECGDSRVYIGIHFRTSLRHGSNLGRTVAHWTTNHIIEPL